LGEGLGKRGVADEEQAVSPLPNPLPKGEGERLSSHVYGKPVFAKIRNEK
jgi:hypothetical protein